IGTLRSIGAQKKTTNFILIGESLVYGVLGGITGCLIGIAILKVIMFIMLKLVSAGGLQVSSGIKYSPFHFLLTFLIALVMCLAGALVPIIIVSKISVKDIILNTISNVKKKKKTRLFLGLAFLLMAFVLAFVSSEENAGQFGMLTMIMTLVAVVILIPYITTIFTRILENLYVFFFGNIGILAAKNLRENKNILNNITMLAIGISSLLFINIIGYESVVEATNKYNNVKYALEMGISNNSRDVIKIISNVDGVEDVYGAYIFNNEQDTDGENSISRVFGVNRLKFTEFWDFESTANSKDVLEELDSGRNIILTNAQKSMLEVEVGDNVNIDINGKKCVYKVIGFNKTILNTSNTALVSERFLKSDMQLQSNMYSYFYIKANKDPVYVKESIEKDLNKKSPLVRTVNELKEEEIDSLKQIILLMQMFCFLAMFIGCFGVVNNLLIGFLQRKHSIAVFRSVGMSKNQTIKMIFIEALSGGIIGGSAGVIGGILMIFNMSLVGDSSTQAHYPLGSFIIYILVGSLVMTIASISPALKSSKIDLVSSLKYE
ncbi:MAG: FtsX-like permease family protein, partial [Clostridiaceae bacterium]|nr:FtsX-like permease family protein [Clostridiaceae bacterium]